MLRNILTIAVRNLFKNRIFAAVNILSLGIALSVCVVAYFNHMFAREFDRTHSNYDRIYRINSIVDLQGDVQEYGKVPARLGIELKDNIPGIEKTTRFMAARCPVEEGENVFVSPVSFIDPEFLEIFTFPVVSGSDVSIKDPGNVLISHSLSSRIFGEDDPLGKSISISNDRNMKFIFTIGGVFSDIPKNSSFETDVLLNYVIYQRMWERNADDWKFNTTAIFILAENQHGISSIATLLDQYVPPQNSANDEFRISRFKLIPFSEVGKNSRYIRSPGLYPSLHPAAVLAPPILAFLILLIACFNFANTTLSSFGKRLKEIALRKTFGGQKSQLVFQFMLETLIICSISLIVGIAFASFLVPAYGKLWSYMSIDLSLFRYFSFWIYLLILLLLTGFLAGIYPAMHVSSMAPVRIIKGINRFKGSGKLSMAFLFLQITISVVTLMMGIVFTKNAHYQRTFDTGYDKDGLIVVPVSTDLLPSFRDEIVNNPMVVQASGTKNHIGFGTNYRRLRYNDKQLSAISLEVGSGYVNTIGLKLVEGRIFNERAEADRHLGSILVNQKLVNDFGWDEAVGQTVTCNDTVRLTVIGVVKDFCMDGVWEKIEPAMLLLSSDEQQGVMAVRTEVNDVAEVLEYLHATWKQRFPNYVFRGMRQTDMMQEEINVNKSIVKMNSFLAAVAIILSLLGLYNLVSLDLIKRTKEMGIRKIMGAPVFLIMYLSGKKFLNILFLGTLFGCYGGYKLSLAVLDSVWDYHTSIGLQIIFITGSIMLIASTITIIFRITRASYRSPVDSLRYE